MPYSTLNRRRRAFLVFAWMGLLILSDVAAHGDDLIPKLGLGMHQGMDLVPTSTPLRGSPSGPSAGEPKGGEGEVDLGPSDANTDIKYHGTPTPGARVSLGLSGSNAPGTTYYLAPGRGSPSRDRRSHQTPCQLYDTPRSPQATLPARAEGTSRGELLARGDPDRCDLISGSIIAGGRRGRRSDRFIGGTITLSAHGARRRIASRVIAGSRSPVRK